MSRIDFVITNSEHHSAMFLPVMRDLRLRGFACRVLSLCELRGLASPQAVFDQEGFPLVRLFPAGWRSSPSVGQAKAGAAARLRGPARWLVWYLLLRRRLVLTLQPPTRLVVLPNDGAFPFDRICVLLRRTNLPFVVVQEGIRFTTPRTSVEGQSGADAYAVWGPSSAEYFIGLGTPRERLFQTGNPRFDIIGAKDWQPSVMETRKRYGLTSHTLLFLSNPIDDLGFVSTAAKLSLARRFVDALAPSFDSADFRLVVKLHRRESRADFLGALGGFPFRDRISVLRDAALYPLLAACRAAVTFASTAGLEALLFGIPLAVLEIPGVGFVHDFVDRGAARGLTWKQPMQEQIEAWLDTANGSSKTRELYLESTLAHREGAAGRVVDVIEGILQHPVAPERSARVGACG